MARRTEKEERQEKASCLQSERKRMTINFLKRCAEKYLVDKNVAVKSTILHFVSEVEHYGSQEERQKDLRRKTPQREVKRNLLGNVGYSEYKNIAQRSIERNMEKV